VVDDLSPPRRRVLQLLKRDPRSAAELARELGITVAAVRQHLDAMADRGLVTPATQAPSGRGRPASKWLLTPRADSYFPDRHADLMLSLIRALRSSLGDEGLSQVIRARDAELVASYRARLDMEGPADVYRRAAALAGIRTDEGYMAEVRADGENQLLLIENHCPICEGAKACTSLCRSELDVFRAVLGDEVSVDREEHLLSGDRRCVYRLRPNGSVSTSPRPGRVRPAAPPPTSTEPS
jgi:predicted ArsR family transcriptional regulator